MGFIDWLFGAKPAGSVATPAVQLQPGPAVAAPVVDEQTASEAEPIPVKSPVQDSVPVTSVDLVAPEPELLLDDLYRATLEYRQSEPYLELSNYMVRFREYAPYNAFLVKMQRPSAGYVATPGDWARRFGRQVKPDARAIVILRPFGPVMFVYDIEDTTGEKPPPKNLLEPYTSTGEFPFQIWSNCGRNAEVEGIKVKRVRGPKSEAGYVRRTAFNPPAFELVVNSEQELSTAYSTLVHELAHVYCGHLGPHPRRVWPDRQGLTLSEREFEAESVSYIVCARQGLKTNSNEYLAGHMVDGRIPAIDIHRVVLAAGRIEEMGKRLKKKPANPGENLLEVD